MAVTGVGVLTLVLAGCTPADNAEDVLEWAVANHTADTLWVSVRYPLDSLRLTDEQQIDQFREQLRRDSLRGDLSRYNSGGVLTRITPHRGEWYWVRSKEADVNAYLDNEQRWARLDNRTAGVLTYSVPPRCTQVLARTMTSSLGRPWWQRPSKPRILPIVGLWLRQGVARCTLKPGQPLRACFRSERTGQEHQHSARSRVTLTVGPGLVPVVSLLDRLKWALFE